MLGFKKKRQKAAGMLLSCRQFFLIRNFLCSPPQAENPAEQDSFLSL